MGDITPFNPDKKNKEPFSDTDQYRIEHAFPLFKDSKRKIVAGVFFFDLTMDSWNIVYCHTTMMRGLIGGQSFWQLSDNNITPANASLDVQPRTLNYTSFESVASLDSTYRTAFLDYIAYPTSALSEFMDGFIDEIITKESSILNNPNSDLSDLHKRQLLQLLIDLRDDSLGFIDFTLDVYIPPFLLQETEQGHYMRPSFDREYRPYDNPASGERWKKAPINVIRHFHYFVTKTMPKLGMSTAFDISDKSGLEERLTNSAQTKQTRNAFSKLQEKFQGTPHIRSVHKRHHGTSPFARRKTV